MTEGNIENRKFQISNPPRKSAANPMKWPAVDAREEGPDDLQAL
jgi:hypothetical protein